MTTSSVDLRDLASPVAATKYAAAKRLLALAQTNARSLYPQLDQFVELMGSDNQILKWTAIGIVGHLAAYDTEGRIEKIMPMLYSQLSGGSMITANNTIAALADIAVSKPSLKKKITEELLKVEGYRYDTDECHNIVLGKAILALQQFMPNMKADPAVAAFVTRQSGNTRPATKTKADAYVKRSERPTRK